LARDPTYAGVCTSRQPHNVALQGLKIRREDAAPAARSTGYEAIFNRQSGLRYPPAEEYYGGYAGLTTEASDVHRVRRAHKAVGAPAQGSVMGRVLHGSDSFGEAPADLRHFEGSAGKSPWDTSGEGLARRFFADNDPREARHLSPRRSCASAAPRAERPAGVSARGERARGAWSMGLQYRHPYLKHAQQSDVIPHLALTATRDDLHAPAYTAKYGGAAGLHAWELGAIKLRHAGYDCEKPAAANDPVL